MARDRRASGGVLSRRPSWMWGRGLRPDCFACSRRGSGASWTS